MYYAKTFTEQVTKALAHADKQRMWLLDAFEWSVHKIKEIRVHNPEWSQEWFADEIQRVLNVNAWEYSRTVRKLGGGRTKECIDKGREFMEKFGVHQSYRAEKLLLNKELDELREKVETVSSKKEFQDQVKDLLRRRRKNKKNNKKKGSKNKAYLDIVKENKQLKEEVVRLKKKIAFYQENLKQMMATVEE